MIQGTVIHGEGIGKTLGFPTANIDCSKKDITLDSGVYAVWAIVNNQTYPAALAVQRDPWKVEVYLIDYKGNDLYGIYIELEIVKKISEMKQFDVKEDLKEKITKDVDHIKYILTC